MINPDRIGHVVLKVRDLERSRRFYSEVLGLDVMSETPNMVFLASHRRDHHEIALLAMGDAAEAPRHLQVGLAHVAFRLSDEAELVKGYRELKERNVPISFTVHHGVAKSVYFLDPDGNQLEIYCDVPTEQRPKLPNDYMGMEKLDFAPDDSSFADAIKQMGIAARRQLIATRWDYLFNENRKGLPMREDLSPAVKNIAPTGPLWDEHTGATRDLVKGYQGKQLGDFNDLTVDDYGSVWSGDVGRKGAEGSKKPAPGDLFRIDPDGTVTQMDEGILGSNGLGFSPDRKLLYYADSGAHVVYAYDVTPQRTLKNRRVFAKADDGIATASHSTPTVMSGSAVVYTSNLVCFKPDGTILKRPPCRSRKWLPDLRGPDLMDLYAVTVQTSRDKGSLYRTRSEVPGLPIPKGKFKG